MKSLLANSPEQTPAPYWSRPRRSRFAIVLLSAATAALGGESSVPSYEEAPLIGQMTVTATRLTAAQPASLASVADLGSMTVTARREPVPAKSYDAQVAKRRDSQPSSSSISEGDGTCIPMS